MPRKRKIRFTHKKKRKKKRNYNMILLPVVPDILITVHDVITSVDGIQVPYPNVLTSPREGRCAGNFCSIPFSREKPHLEVKVMALSEVDVVTIGFGDICSDTLRSIPGRCFGFGTWGYSSDDGYVYKYRDQVSDLGSFRQGDVILMSFHPGRGTHKGVLTVKKNGVQVGEIELDLVIPSGFPIGPSSWMIGFWENVRRVHRSEMVVHFSTMS